MKGSNTQENEEIFLFKCTMDDWAKRVRGRPHRIICIPESYTLYQLAEAVIESFDFDFEQMFGFYNNIHEWMLSDLGYELFYDRGEASRFLGVEKTRISDVFRKIDDKMLLHYDYGDEWQFIVRHIETETPDANITYPVVVESVGNPPPQYGYPLDRYIEDDSEYEED